MIHSMWAVVHEGRIELLERVDLPEGTRLLVTMLGEEDEFWQQASQVALDTIWDNAEDDVYARLLEE